MTRPNARPPKQIDARLVPQRIAITPRIALYLLQRFLNLKADCMIELNVFFGGIRDKINRGHVLAVRLQFARLRASAI